MKIFFIRNVPNNIPWSLKVFPVMPVTIFPRKTMKNSCFFLPVCHCGTLYSKSVIPCARPNTALWRPAARQLQSDGSLRLITPRSSPSSMLRTWWFTYSVSFFFVKIPSIRRVLMARIPPANFQLCNTAGAAFLKSLIWWAGFILSSKFGLALR